MADRVDQDALSTGLSALTPARGLPWMDFVLCVFGREGSFAMSRVTAAVHEARRGLGRALRHGVAESVSCSSRLDPCVTGSVRSWEPMLRDRLVSARVPRDRRPDDGVETARAH